MSSFGARSVHIVLVCSRGFCEAGVKKLATAPSFERKCTLATTQLDKFEADWWREHKHNPPPPSHDETLIVTAKVEGRVEVSERASERAR